MKFGVRECADVVLRSKVAQKIGNKIFYKNEPVCYFTTLKTSSMEGSSSTVYAQGGRGNSRLMSWDGEKTLTFTMEDALISPVGLSILAGAGLLDASEQTPVIQHVFETVAVDKSQLNRYGMPVLSISQAPYEEEGQHSIYVMGLDENGDPNTEPFIYTSNGLSSTELGKYSIRHDTIGTYAGIPYNPSGVDGLGASESVLVDYYVKHTSGATQIDISPDKFGGTFYLEASTLWRDQGSGKDLPAEFIIPSCRVQSNFTFSLSSSGDPSSFTFTMDAFPDYTRWDRTKKVLAAIQVVNTAGTNDIERSQTWANQSDLTVTKTGEVVLSLTEEPLLKPSDLWTLWSMKVKTSDSGGDGEDHKVNQYNLSIGFKQNEGLASSIYAGKEVYYDLYETITDLDGAQPKTLIATGTWDDTTVWTKTSDDKSRYIARKDLNPQYSYTYEIKARCEGVVSPSYSKTIDGPWRIELSSAYVTERFGVSAARANGTSGQEGYNQIKLNMRLWNDKEVTITTAAANNENNEIKTLGTGGKYYNNTSGRYYSIKYIKIERQNNGGQWTQIKTFAAPSIYTTVESTGLLVYTDTKNAWGTSPYAVKYRVTYYTDTAKYVFLTSQNVTGAMDENNQPKETVLTLDTPAAYNLTGSYNYYTTPTEVTISVDSQG